MDWLHNPLADMGSIEYLVTYALIAALAICAIRVQIALADRTRGLPPPAVETDRDPSEIAYLRGGSKELLQFTIFDLIRRGLLRVSDPAVGAKKSAPTIETTDLGRQTAPDPSQPLETLAIVFYETPRKPEDARKSDLSTQADAIGSQRYEPKLASEGMLTMPEVRGAARAALLVTVIALIAIALYRFAEASAKGHHNVAFIFIEAIAAISIVALFSRTGRLSARGMQFLARLKTAVEPMRSTAIVAGASMMPIFVAVTGTAVLAGTPYAPVNRIYGANASGSSNSCSSGSSCSGGSSSCGGGGGCGGGCGG